MKNSILLFAVACATASPLHAQTDKPSLADTTYTHALQGIEVVSTRATSTTPMAFSNLTQQQIEAVNHGKDIPSLLSMLPSVTFSSDAGMGIGYTGIHVRGTDPTRINITANGIPLNDAESSQLYWVNMGDFASSVQSIQMQRGVGTSTNGAGAFGATINMQTAPIGPKPAFGIDLAAGSYGTHKETLRFSTGLFGNRRWGLQGRLSNIASDGYIDHATSRLNSYFLQGGYFAQRTVMKLITFNGWEKTYMAWDYASRADMEKYGRTYNPSGLYTDTEGVIQRYPNQTDNYHQQHYQLIWNQTLADAWKLNTALHYTHGKGFYEQYKSNQKLYKYHIYDEAVSKSDLVRQKRMENDFYGLVASLNYERPQRVTANIGGAINRYDGDHFGRVVKVTTPGIDYDRNHRYYDNNAVKTDANLYLKATYMLLPAVSVFGDVQTRWVNYKMRGTSQEYDDDKQQMPLSMKRNYKFFNPKAGITYQPASHHTLYASYAIAHKEPTRNDFEDMLAEAETVNPKAERLNDLEVGYRYSTPKLNFSVNAYWMDYDNQFVLTGAQDANGEMVARNIKDSYRLGVELAAGWTPMKGLRWDINATWSRNRAKNMQLTVLDEQTWEQSKYNVGTTHLAFSPEWIVNNMISYEWNNLKCSLTSKYVGSQYMTNSNFRSYTDQDGNRISAMLNAYFTTDFDISYTLRFRHVKTLTLGVTVYNLFNKKYESNGSCSMNFRRTPNGIESFGNWDFWSWATYSAQAPAHFLAHLSINL